jgi:hypothetical protein
MVRLPASHSCRTIEPRSRPRAHAPARPWRRRSLQLAGSPARGQSATGSPRLKRGGALRRRIHSMTSWSMTTQAANRIRIPSGSSVTMRKNVVIDPGRRRAANADQHADIAVGDYGCRRRASGGTVAGVEIPMRSQRAAAPPRPEAPSPTRRGSVPRPSRGNRRCCRPACRAAAGLAQPVELDGGSDGAGEGALASPSLADDQDASRD